MPLRVLDAPLNTEGTHRLSLTKSSNNVFIDTDRGNE